MNKYIDAEKLNAGIEKIRQEMIKKGEQKDLHDAEIIRRSVINSCNAFLALIPSLQQEQPEVDLEREAESYWVDAGWSKVMTLGKFKPIARHFYELGINAKKEK